MFANAYQVGNLQIALDAAALSPDGSCLVVATAPVGVSGGNSGVVYIFDTASDVSLTPQGLPVVTAVSADVVDVAVSPQMPLPEESFDLIYGISVMTHLREADHLSWLKELSRLTKPGGIALLKTMGETAFWRGRLPWNLFAAMARRTCGIIRYGIKFRFRRTRNRRRLLSECFYIASVRR